MVKTKIIDIEKEIIKILRKLGKAIVQIKY